MEQAGPDNPELDALHCPDCGYHLRGLTGARCPECGYSLDDVRDSTVSRIAWVHRGDIGTVRAYWRTVCAVSFRHKRFCDEIARPVSYADAQAFRWMTILHVYLPLIALSAIFYVVVQPSFGPGEVDDVLFTYWLFGVPQVFGLPLLIAATGIPSYFFHPKALDTELQNRAIGLSYYSSAVLAWTPFVAMLVLGSLLEDLLGEYARLAVTISGIAVVVGMIAAWWFDLMHIARRTMPHLRRRIKLIGIGVPFLWSVVALVMLGVLPVLALYIFVGVVSVS